MNAVADRYDRDHGGARRATAAARAVTGLLGPVGRVLDLGAGPGTVARHLPGHVVGVEPDAARAGAARASVPVVRGDGAALPFRSSTFDAVVSVWALHLVADTDAVVDEIARVLRPGGTLVTTVDKQAVDAHVGRRTTRPMLGDTTPVLVTAAARVGLALCGATAFACAYDDGCRAAYPVLAFRSSRQ